MKLTGDIKFDFQSHVRLLGNNLVMHSANLINSTNINVDYSLVMDEIQRFLDTIKKYEN